MHRGITPASQTFELPFEFSDKVGPLSDMNFELGYNLVHKGPRWLDRRSPSLVVMLHTSLSWMRNCTIRARFLPSQKSAHGDRFWRAL